VLIIALMALPVHGQSFVEHDPWLNWDVINNTGQPATDFEIVVESPTFSVNMADPSQFMMGQFTSLNFDHTQDVDGDLDLDTIVSWSNPVMQVQPGLPAHIGLLMNGSGPILDAYWTGGGVRIPGINNTPPVVMETTRILFEQPPPPGEPQGVPQVTMRLAMPELLYEQGDPEQLLPQITHLRTFVDIPADMLSLGSLSLDAGLDLSGPYGSYPPGYEWLQPYEREPLVNGLPVTAPLEFWPDSFFDVFIDTTLNTGPEFESLLYAEVQVLDQGVPRLPVEVRFWNLNPQCPEPGTLALVGLAALLLRRRAN